MNKLNEVWWKKPFRYTSSGTQTDGKRKNPAVHALGRGISQRERARKLEASRLADPALSTVLDH